MEKVYSKLSNKILEIFQKKKKSQITFAKAKHSKTVRLNLTCNFMQYMMTEEILNLVTPAQQNLPSQRAFINDPTPDKKM